MCLCMYIYIDRVRERDREREKREREREREREERREGDRMHRHACALMHTCAADVLIIWRYPRAKRQEFTAGVSSANFGALNAEKRAKETRCAPAKRLEFTARMPFNCALIKVRLHALALGPRQRPGASPG